GLDDETARAALARAAAAAADGRRVLAVAETTAPRAAWLDDPRAYGFTWLGFVALADPLRAGVPEAIARCREAGVRVVMITGDHPGTAAAIARQAGIDTAGGVLTGAAL